MNLLCPICKSKLTEHNRNDKTDFTCVANESTHHYSERRGATKLVATKLRVSEGEKRFYIKNYYKPYYQEEFSEIWEGVDNLNRIKINGIISQDFKDIDSVRNKIKTYLLFS